MDESGRRLLQGYWRAQAVFWCVAIGVVLFAAIRTAVEGVWFLTVMFGAFAVLLAVMVWATNRERESVGSAPPGEAPPVDRQARLAFGLVGLAGLVIVAAIIVLA